ncbi:MarR family winged helix-turn-helix transcriptional regulator [Curtobacterium sp. NPDC090217]|uniref:MarR family winged helix-turn-helix transcriptional regulator n=1 Tax=Curtobacterium sp. NPDC090217 TaxID=3363970 RepID=UPI00381083F9
MSTPALSADDWALWHAWVEAHRAITEQVDARLRSATGVSKAEFSVLRTLGNAPQQALRVVELATELRWEKSRIAHLLTRMEHRGLVARVEDGAPGRRTAVMLSADGRLTLREALRVHEENVSGLFTSQLTDEQATAIRTWSKQVISASAPREGTKLSH